MRKFSILLVFIFIVGLLSGCVAKEKIYTNNSNNIEPTVNSQTTSDDVEKTETIEADFSKTNDDMFTKKDKNTEFDRNSAVLISLNNTEITSTSDSVKTSGSKVTITEQATYIVSGELADGTLVVDAKDTDKIQIVFDGVNIKNKTSAAVYVLNADKVFITVADGTSNTIENGGEFVAIDDNNIDGAIFSKQDITLNGGGSLNVISPSGHGIVCKDDLVIASGTYVINSALHGIEANDSIRIADAFITIDAGKDAIHSENDDDASKGFVYISGGNLTAEAEGDGIVSGAYMHITDGNINLLVGGGSKNGTKERSDSFGGFMGGGRPGGMRSENSQTSVTTESGTSMKGLKSANDMLISGGDITINSADDSVHSNTSVTINGGKFNLASGDDAIHAEDTLTVTSGVIDISTSYEGLEAKHVDVQGGEVKLVADDDGINAAGGADQSGITGGRDGMFGAHGGPGGPGGHGGMSQDSDGSIKISGGKLYINSSGDGIDANGTLEVSGGHTTLVGPTQGDTAVLDYDKSATITGGTFIGSGSTMMAQSFSNSTQGVIALKVGNQSAGTQILLNDTKGNTIISQTPELDFAIVILSSPELVKGEEYTIVIGNNSDKAVAN